MSQLAPYLIVGMALSMATGLAYGTFLPFWLAVPLAIITGLVIGYKVAELADRNRA